MKDLVKIFFAFVLAVMMSTSVSAQDHDMPMSSDEPIGTETKEGMLYGTDFDGSAAVEFTDLVAGAEKYDGQEVTVRGYVSEVCTKMGCWLVLSQDGKSVRVVTLHKFFVPKDYSGMTALITGKFAVSEYSAEDEEHYKEESSNPDNVTEPQKESYTIEATGVKFVD